MLFANLRASAYRIGTIAFGVLAVALLIAALSFRASGISARADAASARKEASEARAEVKAISAARDKEAASAKAANEVAAQYEKDKRDAEAAGKRTADELRAGNLRLRAQWQGCEARRMPTSSGSASEPDAAADDRAESAGRIIGAADAADAQIRALQNFLRDVYGR